MSILHFLCHAFLTPDNYRGRSMQSETILNIPFQQSLLLMSVRVNFGYAVNKICIENILISDHFFSIQSSCVGSLEVTEGLLSTTNAN